MTDQGSTVSFVFSRTTLLSGGLDACYDVDAPSCSGGIALIRAFLRLYSDGIDKASLVINRLDYQSVFVQMHPLDWNVNRLILHDHFGINSYWAYPSLMDSHYVDSQISKRDLSGLQTTIFRPFIHGNVVVGTTNSWSQYIENIHFDEDTGLVLIWVDAQFISAGDISSLPPVEAARALMNYVAQENRRRGCHDTLTLYDTYLLAKNLTDLDDDGTSQQKCWIPVMLKSGGSLFQPFLDAVLKFEHQPTVLINNQNHDELYQAPSQIGDSKMWVLSYEDSESSFRQLRIALAEDQKTVSNVTVLEHDLSFIPNITKDDELRSDLAYLRQLADEAVANDPIQGYSEEMPIARIDTYRACFGGECPIGNLFSDALRWYTGADFAFINSGGVRGEGWPAGPVKVSDIWAALPFANTECTGTISGVTLFRLFELSTREASYVSEIVTNGDRVFQVSGLRYTYNTLLEAPRLIKLEILDRESNDFVPVERLKFYKYATSSWECSGFYPFPGMLSEELNIEGEEPSQIGDQLLQNIVGEFLRELHSTEPYDTSIQGRLVNDTSMTEVLDFIQTEKSCTSSSYWVEEFQSCFLCPSTENVILSGSGVDFLGVSGIDAVYTGSGDIVNGEDFPVRIAFKSKPNWATITTEEVFGSDDAPALITIAPGETLFFEYAVNGKQLQPGVATGSLSFAVVDGGNFPGCVGRDLVLGLSQTVSNSPEFFGEGSIRIVGFTMVGIITVTSFSFAAWVYSRREKKAVKMMQPIFLLAICFGVFVIGMSIFVKSLHGWDHLSARGEDMACMGTAWLLSMGFSLVMSALLAKLWRINKVVDGARAFRRTNVSVKSAVRNFSAQFVVNFLLMLMWTVVDPMRYEIQVVEGEDWKFYGTCGNLGITGWTLMGLSVGINFCILLLAVYEAYKARNLGEEYSESAGLGLAIFSWLQLLIVVVPVIFLIEDDNVNPRYFLSVSLVFACCMSMLLFIFVPLIVKVRRHELPQLSRERSFFGKYRLTSSKLLAMGSFRQPQARASAPPPALQNDYFTANIEPNHRRAISMMTTIPATEVQDPGVSEKHSLDFADYSARAPGSLDESITSDSKEHPIQELEETASPTTEKHLDSDFDAENMAMHELEQARPGTKSLESGAQNKGKDDDIESSGK